MPISEPEWTSIRSMIERTIRQLIGSKADFFITGKVLKVDALNKCIYMKEFGSQAIPIVAFEYDVPVYDHTPSGTKQQVVIPSVRLQQLVATAQSIPNGTWTPIVWDSESYDTDNMHSNAVNPTRITCNTPGRYLIYGSIGFVPGAGVRGAYISKNGAVAGSLGSYGSQEISTAITVNPNATDVLDLNTGDYVEIVGYQNIGAASAVQGGLSVFIAYYLGYNESYTVRKVMTKATVRMPKVGQMVLVAREMGTNRLPRCLGVIQGRNWIAPEEE